MSGKWKQWSRVLLGFFFYATASAQTHTIRPLDERGLDSLISERNGKILVLNVWATWCAPCKEEFPDLITLAKSIPHKDVEIAALSVDYPDETESLIAPFIRQMDPPFPVFVSAIESQDTLINKLEPRWNGAIPATLIFDAKGKRQLFLTGLQTLPQFKKAVDDVLRKR
jgi:thiol-disulfide isomerase/thioredoxin